MASNSYFKTLCLKYPDVSTEILQGYEPSDEYIYYHENDLDLHKIRVELPSPPSDLREVEGFGKPAKDQKWHRPIISKRLKNLLYKISYIDGNPDDFWDELYTRNRYYRKEINFIKQEQKRKLYGYWLYINGKLTYMDGWHYFYCAWYEIDIGFPQYRSRDLKFFHFAKYCYTTTETVVYSDKKDGDDNFIPELHDDGTCVMKDIGFRTCFGFNYPKHRREGATYKGANIAFCIITEGLKRRGGFQSMTGNAAQKGFFTKYIEPVWGVPIFFKPNTPRNVKPQHKLNFNSIYSSSKSLGGIIEYAESAGRSYFDGTKLYFYHDDETGKTEEEDVFARAMVTKKCLVVGANIIGFTIKTSTVGEMNSGGGTQFKNICDGSHFERRDKNGQTGSGYFNLFLSAEDGYEGFIDDYGNSIMEDPTPQQAKFINRDIGSKEFLKNAVEHLESKSDQKSMEELDEIKRQTPQQYRDCFRSAGTKIGFNQNKLQDRITHLTFDKQYGKRGNYVLDSNMFSRFVEDPDGSFYVTRVLPEEMTNRKVKIDDVYHPENEYEYIHSSDPFKFNKTESGKGSDFGFALYWMRDYTIDELNKKREDFLSDRFIVTYSSRKDKTECYEDALACMLYWGGKHYPENNVEGFYEWLIAKGFGGYLLYGYDIAKNSFKQNPGFFSNESVKTKIFGSYKTHIEVNIFREQHLDLIKQCSSIKGTSEMTHYDLFTAGGGCLLGKEELHKLLGYYESDPEDHRQFPTTEKTVDDFDYESTRGGNNWFD